MKRTMVLGLVVILIMAVTAFVGAQTKSVTIETWEGASVSEAGPPPDNWTAYKIVKDKLNIDWKEVVGRLRARVPDGFVEKPVLDPAEFMRLVDDVTGGRATAPAAG